jgi:putative Mg2+ transporter-C (MgtC) family protein
MTRVTSQAALAPRLLSGKARPVNVGQVVVQIVLATAMGAAIGLEREINAQPAGFRTHVLVSLGAMLFTLAGTQFVHADLSRVAASVASGIGFLGGGAILREGTNVRGLTTAASLWVTAAVGLAVGIRAYVAAAIVVVVVLAVLTVLKYVEREYFPRRRGVQISLQLDEGAHLAEAEAAVADVVGGLRTLRVSRSGGGEHLLVMQGRPQPAMRITEIAQALRRLPGVRGVDVRH